LYVLPHGSAGGFRGLKPICTHNKRISDFCSWRGMLVLTGIQAGAAADGHCIPAEDDQVGLWFGDVDDLWQMGKPRGRGGPWKKTHVQAGTPSDPFLMTGFDHKTLHVSHNADQSVTFVIEVDFLRDGSWLTYQKLTVPPGQSVAHEFPDGFSAHWARLTAGVECEATAEFVYD
jgi:hypothetical protein